MGRPGIFKGVNMTPRETVALLDRARDRIKANGNGDLLATTIKRIQEVYDRHAKLKPPVDQAQREFDDLIAEWQRVRAKDAADLSESNGNGHGDATAVQLCKVEVQTAVEMNVIGKGLAKAQYKLESVKRTYLKAIRTDLHAIAPELEQTMKAAEIEICEAFNTAMNAALMPAYEARTYLAQHGAALGDQYQRNSDYFHNREFEANWARQVAQSQMGRRV